MRALEDELCEGKRTTGGLLTEVRASLQRDADHLSRPEANLATRGSIIVVFFFFFFLELSPWRGLLLGDG